MQYRSKKLLSLLLAVLMIVSLLPSAAFADEADPAISEEVVAETPVEEPVEPTEAPAEDPVEEEPVVEPTEAPAEDPVVEPTEVPVVEEPVDEDEFLSVTSLEGAGAGDPTSATVSDAVAFENALYKTASVVTVTLGGSFIYRPDWDYLLSKDVTIDLNGQTLTVDAGNLKIPGAYTVIFKNGTVNLTNTTDLDNSGFFYLFDGATLTFDDVDIVVPNENTKSLYLFNVGDSSSNKLNLLNGTTVEAKNLTSACVAVFRSGTADADVTVSNSTITSTGVARGFLACDVTLTDSNVTISDASKNGFYTSNLTVNGKSTLSISGCTDKDSNRGGIVTNGTVTINGGEVSITDCGNNPTISLTGSNKTVTVAEGASLKVETSPAEGTTITGNGTFTDESKGPAEVGTYDELVAALAKGGEITLTGDIVATSYVDFMKAATLDLNEHKLTMNAENGEVKAAVTIKNGEIHLNNTTDNSGSGFFWIHDGASMTLDSVSITSAAGGSYCYTIFNIQDYTGTAAALTLNNCTVNVKDFLSGPDYGSIVAANLGDPAINITGSTITGTNIGRGFANGNITLTNSNVTLKGEGERANLMEHGINYSELKLVNSNVTIDGLTGRGITAGNGPITVDENSTVSVTNCTKATIELRENKTLMIEEGATVTVDKAPQGEGGAALADSQITGTVTDTSAVFEVDSFEALKSAIAAGRTNIKLTDNITIDSSWTHTFNKNTVIDLGNNTIKVNAVDNLFYGSANVTFKNGTIDVSGADGSAPGHEAIFVLTNNASLALTLDRITLTGENYHSAGGIFRLQGNNNSMAVKNCTLNLSGEKSSNGGIFMSTGEDTVLTIEETTMTLENVGRVVISAKTTITNSTITAERKNGGNMEHGFNSCGKLTIDNSNVTMSGLVGRGITTNGGDVEIKNGSNVNLSNCGEGDILYKVVGGRSETATISVDATSSLSGNVIVPESRTLTVKATDSNGTVTDTVLNSETTANLPKLTVTNGTANLTDSVAKIGTVGYASLREAVKAAEGKSTVTITLLKDVPDGQGVIFESGKHTGLTIDFNGKTYTIAKDLVGSSNATIGFQMLRGNTITLKNGKLTTSTNSCWMLIQNYCNLTLKNIELDGTGSSNLGYVLSNNFGTTNINDGTTIKAPSNGYAFDVYGWRDGGYDPAPIVNLNVTAENAIQGNIEMASNKVSLLHGTLNVKDSKAINGKISINNAGKVVSTAETTDTGLAAKIESVNKDNKIVRNDDGSYTIAPKTYVAKVGTKGYETLDEAIKAAAPGNTVTITAAGTYTLPAFTKNLTISAAANTAVTIDVVKAVALSGASVTFNNITFDYYPNTHYVGLQHTNEMIYNNCTFNGQVFLYGAKETFNNCTFNQNSADAYNVWTYGAKETLFNNCTFNSVGKCILVYNEGNGDVKGNELTITNSALNASDSVDGKAAIEIDTSLMANGAKITVDGNTTATGFANGSISGNPLWNNKKGSEGVNNDITVTVDGTKVLFPAVAQIDETRYETLADAFKAAQGMDSATIKVLDDCIFVNRGATDALEETTVKTNVTLDLNGHEVNCQHTDGVTSSVFALIVKAGSLTIKDSSEAKDGIIKAGRGISGNAIQVYGGASFTMESGTVYCRNNVVYTNTENGEPVTINVNGGKLEAETTTENSAALYLANANNALITVNINGGELKGQNGILHWNNLNLTITDGTITATDLVGIWGNGQYDNTEIKIKGGSITAPKEAAIYHPQDGTLTISGGTLSGKSAIVAKSGTITISGGTFKGTGPKVAYTPVSSGFDATGDALLIDHYGPEYGTPTVTITGGTFESTHAKAIASEVNPNKIGLTAVTGFVSGGTFKGADPIESTLAATGYEFVANADGSYGVQTTIQDGEAAIGNTVYATLAEAIAAANASETSCNINILSNVETAPEAGSITKAMTFVNLGGYTIGGVAAETALTAALDSTLKLTNMADVVYTVTVRTEEDNVVAKISTTEYTKVADALNAAQSGQTITLVADANEADSTLVLNSGVKLDLDSYTLTAKALVGAEGSSVTGAIYGAADGYAKLKVDTLVLDETPATVNLLGTDYSLIPIYDPANSCYILSAYVPYYDANNNSCIFTTDNNTIRFDFSQVASGTVRKDILTGKYSANSNKYRIAVTLSWENDNGTYNQTYVYKDSFVQTVSNYEATSRYYTFTLTGFDTLGLTEANMDTLRVQASVITDSGVVSAISPQAN